MSSRVSLIPSSSPRRSCQPGGWLPRVDGISSSTRTGALPAGDEPQSCANDDHADPDRGGDRSPPVVDPGEQPEFTIEHVEDERARTEDNECPAKTFH